MEENQSLLDLTVDQEASSNLLETARWAKFFGMFIIICTILGILSCVLLWNYMDQFITYPDEHREDAIALGKTMIVIVAVIVGTVVFILMGFLVRGANRIRNGIRNKDQMMFNSGLANVKNFFAMWGVITILGLVLTLIGVAND